MLSRSRLALPLLTSLALSCEATPDPAPTPPPPAVYEVAGPHPVGVVTVALHDTTRDRDLRVEIWYPADDGAADAASKGFSIAEFAASGPDRDALTGLLATAPDPGTSRTAHAARDAKPAEGTFPLVAFSHCYDCTRFSTFTIAERLASHGIAVIAPDHTGGTLFDKLAGTDAPLDTTFLATRAADLRFALDRALDPSATELPSTLVGRFDPARVGVFGHSFGGVTAGLVLMHDTRPRAGLALAVPMENPLLAGVTVNALHVPLFFLLAEEDNSIGSIGNAFIEQNFADANPPAYELDVADAGHWSVTDICGVVPDFDAGCTTEDARQTNGEDFVYADPRAVRGIAASYVTAFFLATLEDDAAALDYVRGAHPAGRVKPKARE